MNKKAARRRLFLLMVGGTVRSSNRATGPCPLSARFSNRSFMATQAWTMPPAMGLRDEDCPLAVGMSEGLACQPKPWRRLVGVSGFEPPTSWSQTRRSNQTELHPEVDWQVNDSVWRGGWQEEMAGGGGWGAADSEWHDRTGAAYSAEAAASAAKAGSTVPTTATADGNGERRG